MKEWKTIKISEIYEGLFDGPHATPPDSNEGAVFLGISNITKDGHIDLSEVKHISVNDLPKWTKRVIPQEGDIVFSYEATLNLYGIIPNGFWGCLGRRMALIRPDENKCHGKFLYYYFFSPNWRNTIAENTILGATVDRIPIAKFPDFPVTIPETITLQKRIANVLSVYDDLIENCQKQIKLLEEAAQRIYKEWFIDMRFPGYENTRISDGIPEGWEKKPLGRVLSIVRGRSYSSRELSDTNGVLMINLSNIRSFGGYNRGQEKRYIGKFSEAQTVRTHDLLMGVTDMTQERRTVGRVAIVPNLKSQAMISMDLIKLVPVNGYSLFYYALLHFGGYSEVLSRFANGTNVLHLRPEAMDNVDIILPTSELQRKYSSIVESIQDRIDDLQDQILLATQARNRLLPKLMSGEIEL